MTYRMALLMALLIFVVGGAGGYFGCAKYPPPPKLVGEQLVTLNEKPFFIIFVWSNGETSGLTYDECMELPACKTADEKLEKAEKRDTLSITAKEAEGSSNKKYPHSNREDHWDVVKI